MLRTLVMTVALSFYYVQVHFNIHIFFILANRSITGIFILY